MKSVLPPGLEAKRLVVAGRHTRRVFQLAVGLVGATIALLSTLYGWEGDRDPRPIFIGLATVVILPLEAYGIFHVSRRNDQTCRELGYLCPHCGKPLYEPRSTFHLTGRCPRCGLSIDPHGNRPVLPTTPGVRQDGDRLAVGTRIRFRKDVVERANGQRPELSHADADETGEITGHGTAEAYWVTTDTWPHSFGVWLEEFEVLTGPAVSEHP